MLLLLDMVSSAKAFRPSFSAFRYPLICAALTLAPALHAAAGGPPPVTVTEPVTIQGTVSVSNNVAVHGVVEELNDVLRTPFAATANSGPTPSQSPTATIDIPDGKRLIIEAISFQASSEANDYNRMFIEPRVDPVGASRLLVPLPIQAAVVDGGVRYDISMLSIKMRLNSISGSTSEIQIRRGNGSLGTLNVAVFGYLVDL